MGVVVKGSFGGREDLLREGAPLVAVVCGTSEKDWGVVGRSSARTDVTLGCPGCYLHE